MKKAVAILTLFGIILLCVSFTSCGPLGPTEKDIEIVSEYYNIVDGAVYVKVKNNYSGSIRVAYKITEYRNNVVVESHSSNTVTLASGEIGLLRAYLLKTNPNYYKEDTYKITGWTIWSA